MPWAPIFHSNQTYKWAKLMTAVEINDVKRFHSNWLQMRFQFSLQTVQKWFGIKWTPIWNRIVCFPICRITRVWIKSFCWLFRPTNGLFNYTFEPSTFDVCILCRHNAYCILSDTLSLSLFLRFGIFAVIFHRFSVCIQVFCPMNFYFSTVLTYVGRFIWF